MCTATRFRCESCGEEHDFADLSLAAPAPAQWDLLSPTERASSILGREQCIIHTPEGTSFFIRAQLEIPVRAAAIDFAWGVWCSLSQRSFDEMHALWEDENR